MLNVFFKLYIDRLRQKAINIQRECMSEAHSLSLIRVSSTEENGTHGVLLDHGVPFALSLEPPDRNNEPYESCIPAGVFICKYVNSPRFGGTYEIKEVPNRSHILFHKGNFTKDTSGCVLVGERFEVVGTSEAAILSSGEGFDEFMKRMRLGGTYEDLVLNIINGYE